MVLAFDIFSHCRMFELLWLLIINISFGLAVNGMPFCFSKNALCLAQPFYLCCVIQSRDRTFLVCYYRIKIKPRR